MGNGSMGAGAGKRGESVSIPEADPKLLDSRRETVTESSSSGLGLVNLIHYSMNSEQGPGGGGIRRMVETRRSGVDTC